MRLIIEARIVDGNDDAGRADNAVLAVIERPDRGLSQLGLTLSEGRSLLAEVQRAFVSRQVDVWLAGQMYCRFSPRPCSTRKPGACRARRVWQGDRVEPETGSCHCGSYCDPAFRAHDVRPH